MTKICIEIDPDGNGNGGQPAARFYSTVLGDGTTAAFSVAHNLNTPDVMYVLRDAVTGDLDTFDVEANSSNPNVLQLQFATPPPAGRVRLLLLAPPASGV